MSRLSYALRCWYLDRTITLLYVQLDRVRNDLRAALRKRSDLLVQRIEQDIV